jgi:ATP-dependent RNA helicase UAP56/SUB2
MPNIHTSIFYSGNPVQKDAKLLKEPNMHLHIVITTPGHLNALAWDKYLNLKHVKHFFLDECNKNLEQLC